MPALSTSLYTQIFPSQESSLSAALRPAAELDTYVRFFAEKMRSLIKCNIVGQNRVGTLGNIATEYVTRAKPDSQTVYITSDSALAANYHVLKNLTIDMGNALQAIGAINKQLNMIMVAAGAPWKNIHELTTTMKQKGDKGSYALANPPARIVDAIFREKAGLQTFEVQYKVGTQYLNNLINGNPDYAIADNALAISQANAARMRILAVSTEERLQTALDYPTLREAGLNVILASWWGGFVPRATSKPIVTRLGAWLSEIVASDESRKFLNGLASDPWISAPDQAQAHFRREIAM